MKTKHCFSIIIFLVLLIQVNGTALAKDFHDITEFAIADGEVSREVDYCLIFKIKFKDGTNLNSNLGDMTDSQLIDDIKNNLILKRMNPEWRITFYHGINDACFARLDDERDCVVKCEWEFHSLKFTSNVTVKGQTDKFDVYTVEKGGQPTAYLRKYQNLYIKIKRSFSDGTSEDVYMDRKHLVILHSMGPADWIELTKPLDSPYYFSPIADRADNLVKIIWRHYEGEEIFSDETEIIVDASQPKALEMNFSGVEVACSDAGKKFPVWVQFDQRMKKEDQAFPKLELEYRENQRVELKLSDFEWEAGIVNIENSLVKFYMELPFPGIDDQIFLRPKYRLSQMSGLGEKDEMELYIKDSGYLPGLHLRPINKTYIFLGKEERIYKPGERLEGWYNIHNYDDNYDIIFYRLNGINLVKMGSRKAGKCSVIGRNAPSEPGKYLIRLEHSYVDANGNKITDVVAFEDYEVVQNN